MDELLKALYLLTLGFSVSALAALLISRRLPWAVRLLNLGYLLLMCAAPLTAYLSLIFSQTRGGWQALGFHLTWFYGPLLYLIVRAGCCQSLSWKYFITHLSVPILIVIEKSFGAVVLGNTWLNYIVLFTLVLPYFVASAKLVWQRRKQFSTLLHSYRDSSYFYLVLLSLGVCLSLVFDLVLILLLNVAVMQLPKWLSLVGTGLCAYVAIIATLTLVVAQKSETGTHVTEVDSGQKAEEGSGRNIHLTRAAAASLEEQLRTLMSAEKLHLQCDVSLEHLAEKLGISRHVASELLNVHMGTSFYDFINALRCEEVIKLLETKGNMLSLSDIAYRAGFNNRNSFYRAFRINTGMTPKQYRQTLIPMVRSL